MTDTSLPNHQSSQNDPQSNSYVDSYNPPAGQAATVNGLDVNKAMQNPPSTTPQQPAPGQMKPQPAPTSNATDNDSDPLAELEKALAEYEAKQKAASQAAPATSAPSPVPAAKPADTSTASQPAASAASDEQVEDPLAELEKVLNEYEARYKQRQEASNKQALDRTQDEPAANQPAVPDTKPDSAPKQISPASQPAQPAGDAAGESIEEQNIFELLGVTDAEQAEKEAFLDELQQALWDDFLEKDLPLLVNQQQLEEIRGMHNDQALPEERRQAEIIKKVEAMVPDVEEIMLEKALKLKEDMVWERVAGMKEYYSGQQDSLTKIDQAEQQLRAGQWRSGSQVLNGLLA